MPTSAVIAVTYRCNSRCKMCNIWKMESGLEMKPEDFARLPQSLNDISITGGEPFLRDDLVAIIDTILEKINPGRIVINTNGFLTERIISITKQLLSRHYREKVFISLSLDGIGQIHEEARGIPNAFELVLTTINRLKGIGFNNIGIAYTFMKGNETEYQKVYDFSKELYVNFNATIAHNADNYFSTSDNQKADGKIVREQINRTIEDKIGAISMYELGKCYYLNGLAYYAETGKQLLPCSALDDSFFMSPEGNIYPCNILAASIGNILEEKFIDLWNGEKAAAIREIVNNCPNPCWMVCTAKPAIKKHWFKTVLWILKEKLSRSRLG